MIKFSDFLKENTIILERYSRNKYVVENEDSKPFLI